MFGKFLYVRVVLFFTLYTTLNLRSPFYSNIALFLIKLVVDHSSYRLTLRVFVEKLVHFNIINNR